MDRGGTTWTRVENNGSVGAATYKETAEVHMLSVVRSTIHGSNASAGMSSGSAAPSGNTSGSRTHGLVAVTGRTAPLNTTDAARSFKSRASLLSYRMIIHVHPRSDDVALSRHTSVAETVTTSAIGPTTTKKLKIHISDVTELGPQNTRRR